MKKTNKKKIFSILGVYAALTGAAMLLLDRSLRDNTARLAKSASVSDLASSPVFSELYMNGMMFE